MTIGLDAMDMTKDELNQSAKEWPVFHCPDLQWFQPPYFPIPPGAPALLSRLEQDHFLILGDVRNPDKRLLCRHLAWLLADLLGLNVKPGAVGEWLRNSGLQRLEIDLEHEGTHPIVILPDLKPQHLGYHLVKIRDMVHQSGHYILVTTDTTAADWRLSELERDELWLDLAPHQIYDPAYLKSYLMHCLKERNNTHPNPLHPNTELYVGMTLENIAVRLEAPFHIQSFLRKLDQYPTPPNREVVEGFIDIIRSDEQAVLTRIQHMDFSERALLTGMFFFNGLPFDQFFAAMDILVETVWRQREPALRLFDRGDLTLFIDLLGLQQEKVELPSRLEKDILLRLLWREHQSLIKAALPTLVAIVRASADHRQTSPDHPQYHQDMDGEIPPQPWLSESIQRDLFSQEADRHRIRLVVGEFLGLLGAYDVPMVERALLELAADPAAQIQQVAAKILASWRESPQMEETLFQLLNRWQKDVVVLKNMERLLDSRAMHTRARETIQMTIARTIGYASVYDPPNHLTPSLMALITAFGQNTMLSVAQCFEIQTLPILLQRHLHQLSGETDRWLGIARRRPYIAQGLALAFPFHPQTTKAFLLRWWDEAMALPKAGTKAPPARRESLLICIALCHGYREDNGRALVAEAYQDWWNILHEETCVVVRKAVFDAIHLRTLANFREMEPCLRQIAAVAKKNELAHLHRTLAEVYFQQRTQLEGGEMIFTYKGFDIPVWLEDNRPPTAVEDTMTQWLNSPDHAHIRQIARDIDRDFGARLDDAEARFIQSLKHRQDQFDDSIQAQKRHRSRLKRIQKRKIGAMDRFMIEAMVSNKRLLPKVMLIWPILRDHPKHTKALFSRLEEEEAAGDEIVYFLKRIAGLYRLRIPAFAILASLTLYLLYLQAPR